jgi:hypothetical protein
MITVTAVSIGDTINAGSGSNTLVVSGGGSAVMGANITGIEVVALRAPTSFIANATAHLEVVGSTVGADIITLDAPSQSVLSGGQNERVLATATNSEAEVSGLGAGSELEITSGGTVTLNDATGGSAVAPLMIKLDAATNLSLSPMQFIDAVGSAPAATLTANASQQTLTGGGGADVLVGYVGGYDLFRDTAAGLNADVIANFVATDQIDVTDLNPDGLTLTASAAGSSTSIHLMSGSTGTTFLLIGSFNQAGFLIAADGSGGTIITHL